MNFEHHFYQREMTRPIPVLYQDDEMIVIITPWNASHEEAQQLIQDFIEHYRYFFSDTQATIPFEQMHSLSIHENYIRTSLLQINRAFFSKNNQEDISKGFECVVLLKTNSEITLAQVGNPQVYLSRNNFILQPTGVPFSLPVLFSSEKQQLAPLPQNLIGVFSDISIRMYSFKFQEDDEFILISKDFIPKDFLNLNLQNFEDIGSFLSQDKESFWLGKVNLF